MVDRMDDNKILREYGISFILLLAGISNWNLLANDFVISGGGRLIGITGP